MAKTINGLDRFVGKIIKVGNSNAIIIPHNNIKYAGLKEGDIIQVWFEKRRKVKK